ncbi:multidrug and toxin extrusion protein 1-like [Lineus longissimus]|uniref:multidrug and toxin extrusion protein 1-like n=1 Tax=Lineus longissimus TaxID=88925 RepID=UPI00315CE70F
MGDNSFAHKGNARDTGQRSAYGSTTDFEITVQPQTKRRRCFPCLPDDVWNELKEVFNLSSTMILISLSFVLMAPISLAFVGRLGTTYLDAVGLGNTMFNITCYTIGNGLGSGCDTVFAQSYGSTNKKMVGIYVQRSFYVLMLFSIPCMAVQLNMEGILRLMGQDEEIAKLTGDYITMLIPAVPANFLYVIIGRYLRNQNILLPVALAGLSGVGASALFHYIFVTNMNLGILGSAYAQCIGFYIQPTILIVYTVTTKVYRTTWNGLSKEGFQGWGMFTGIAVAGLLNACFQWWAFELGTILSGLISDVQLGAQAILFQVEAFTFTAPIAVGISGNIRVGQHLGAMRTDLAKRAIYVTFCFVWCIGVVTIVLMLSLKDYIPFAFSNDPEVVNSAANVIPILALYHIFDGTCAAAGGILRGYGKQRVAAIIVFVGVYLVGLPVGIPLMFMTDLLSAGYWWGLTIALVVETLPFMIYIYRTDFDKEAQLAQIRAGVKVEHSKLRTDKHENVGEEESILGLGSLEEEKRKLIDSEPKTRSRSGARSRSGSRLPYERKYCGEYVSSQIDIRAASSAMVTTLTTKELIFRRSLTLLLVLLIMGIGIFCKFHFVFELTPKPWTELCVFYNGTINNSTVTNLTDIVTANVSLPLCNLTALT